MRRVMFPLIVGALVLAFAAGAWATDFSSAATTGLNSVWMTSSGQNSSNQWYYNFEIRNNTSNTNPLVDANGMAFAVVTDTLEFNTAAAVDGSCPDDWSWQGNKFVKSLVQTGNPRTAPPSVGPGGILPGFQLVFNTEQNVNSFAYLTHVYGVVPIPGTLTPPTTYSAPNDTIVLSDSKLYVLKPGAVNGNTWWDVAKGEDNNDPEREPTVPEASSVLLGAMGLVGPAGYAFSRRKKS